MNADDFIQAAISQGEREGISALSGKARIVFVVSETEVICIKDGIDLVIDRIENGTMTGVADAFAAIGAGEIAACLREIEMALPDRDDAMLSRTNDLVVSCTGYSYESIKRYVETDK